MNLPRKSDPITRPAAGRSQPANTSVYFGFVGFTGVAPSAWRAGGVLPADGMDDTCRMQCNSVRSDSGYNLCVQLCRSGHR